MKLYRYELRFWDEERERFTIKLSDFFVLKTTEKGYWIEAPSYKHRRRFVLKDSRKTFARDTKKQAMDDFIARKIKYGKILRSLDRINKLVIIKAESLTELELDNNTQFVNQVEYGY